MDNSPVKKKKKYVKKVIQVENSESSEVGYALSSTNASQRQKEPFSYSFDEIVNHILAKIIPDNRFVIDLTNGVIIGHTRQIEDIRTRMSDNITCYTGFIIELENGIIREHIEYEAQETFQVCLFGPSILQKKIAETFVGTRFQEDFHSFLKMFKSSSTRLFVRMMRKYQQEFLKKIENKIRPLHKVGISNKQAVRGNRENLKKQVASITIDKQAFDSKKWKQFVSKSDKLKASDIEIIENRNQYSKTETYTIKLTCLQRDSQIRLEGFNYYFKHQDFVNLPTKDSQHKTQIIKQYGNFQKNWLTITFLKGYKSSKWDDKTLVYKIRTDNISKKKTNFTNELFQGFHLIGLLPKVRQYIEQLEHQINNVPLDDLKEQLFLEINEDIRDALRSNKAVQKLIQDFLKDYALKHSEKCKVLSIKFIQRSIKLNILIAKDKEKEYNTTVREQLETILTKQMKIRRVQVDFNIDQQFLGKLEEESIIVTSHKNNHFNYISKQSDFHNNVEKIQGIKRGLQEISQEELFVKGRAKLNKYLDQIRGLKNNGKYQDIYITQPQSLDKINYRIAFVGSRKKNAEFITLVNQRIAEIEKTLGTYYKLINQQQTNFLVDDNEIQERILKNYNMSTVVDPTHKAEAVLEIMPSEPTKTIYFFKSKNLSIVPFNYKIFFVGADQLELFSQKYLDILKMKSKRLMKNDFIKESEPNRKLQLYYKKQMDAQEMVLAALQPEQSQHLACFVLPKQHKQKFIKDLLTFLTYSKRFQQTEYSFIIIDPYEEEDIKTIINLPEFQPNKKDELVIEWSCDGHLYSKSGNSKINDAISKGEQLCILTEDDLSNVRLRVGSAFLCDLQRKILTKVGAAEMPLLIERDCIKFIYKDKIYQLSSKQYNTVKTYLTTPKYQFLIYLTYYQLDLRKETQTNIFSGKIRKLQKHQKLLQIQGEYNGKVHAFYEKCTPALIFSFEQAESKKLSAAVTQILTYLVSNIKTSIIKLKQISEKYMPEVIKMLKSKAEEYELRYQYDQTNNSVTLQSLNEKNIARCQRIIQSEIDYLLMLEKMQDSSHLVKSKHDVKYPDDWRPQKYDIQAFVLDPVSQQFQGIKRLFTVRPIVQVIKIQNRYLYKKYSDQLDHLTYLNKNKRPKQMMLFHGTGQNDPRVIWQDKEEGFNINYSSDRNMLGRGIYFAQKSEYSYSYKHIQPLSTICSMLLCKVIVGDSQQLVMSGTNSHVKDTIIKDNSTGVRYESMKGKHEICDIYVVFKDKRAYPAYLIRFQRK